MRPGGAHMSESRQGGAAAERIDRANRLLSQHRYGSDAHEQGYRLLVELADAPGGAWAQWLLGAYHLQVIHRPDALSDALRWLRAAATAGVPQAIERLSDLCLQGVALPYSLDGAMRYLQTLADGGHAPSAWQLGYLADQDDAPDIGVAPASLLLRACALGFPAAYYSLGWRFAIGRGVARDPVLARALLLRAADAGFRDAVEAADALAADAGPEALALRARLKDNLAAAQPMLMQLARAGFGPSAKPVVAALETHLLSVGVAAFVLDADGRAAVAGAAPAGMAAAEVWQRPCDAPRIETARGFATREECAWLINRVAGTMTSPHDVGPHRSANSSAEIEQFNGEVRALRMLDTDAVMRQLQRRVCIALGWRPARLEPSSVIRYGVGHRYEPHVDYFEPEEIASNREQRGDLGGQRTATFLVYLHAPIRGGETEYTRAGAIVRGEPGMAVVHWNTRDGQPDPDSLHQGREVLKGEKWLWRTALREHSMYG